MTFEVGDNFTIIMLAIIAGLPGLIAALLAHRANEAAKSTRVAVDGRMTELLSVAKTGARAEGIVTGLREASPGTAATFQDNAEPQPVTIANPEPVDVRVADE